MAWPSYTVPDQTGRIAVVTGANSGIGFDAALELARAARQVVLACRDPARARDGRGSIAPRCPPRQLEVSVARPGSLASVREFAAAIAARPRSSTC